MPWEKNFDVDVALLRARETFWERGYDGTSMADLLDAMGIQKGSFYATYGSKREIYDRAMAGYAREVLDGLDALASERSPREALEAVVAAILEGCLSEVGSRGCMVINCAIELAPSDEDAQAFVQETFRVHERFFAKLIRAARDAGEVSAAVEPGPTSKAMLALVMGMRVHARSGAKPALLRTLSRQLLAMLDA